MLQAKPVGPANSICRLGLFIHKNLILFSTHKKEKSKSNDGHAIKWCTYNLNSPTTNKIAVSPHHLSKSQIILSAIIYSMTPIAILTCPALNFLVMRYAPNIAPETDPNEHKDKSQRFIFPRLT